MKISKLIVPIVALTLINNNQVREVKAGPCEDSCSNAFSHGMARCTEAHSIPLLALGCYAGCGVFLAGCMGLCAAAK